MQKLWNSSLIVLLLLNCPGANAQNGDDLALVINERFAQNSFSQKRQVTYLFAGKHPVVKYNPVSLFFGGMLMLYQSTVSHLIGAACPYEVNCSDFSRQCIRRFGLFKGIPLTADRLTRCTRLALIDMVQGVDYSVRRKRIFDDPADYGRRVE